MRLFRSHLLVICEKTFKDVFSHFRLFVYWNSIQDMKALELELTLKANYIFELSAVAEKRIS